MIDPASDVSVVLTTYNGSHFLAEQLESIAAQTLLPSEVLVYDDGSRTEEIAAIRTIVARYPAAVLVAGSNVGITANFNRAILAAQRPFVALSDQDDIWTRDHLAVLRRAIDSVDLVYADMLFMDAAGHVSSERFSDRFRTIGMDSRDPNLFEALLHNSIVWGAAALFRRNLIDQMPIVATPRHHDWWLSMLATSRAGIRYVDHVIAYHRLHAANASSHHEGAPVAGAMPGRGAKRRRRLRAERNYAALTALNGAMPARDAASARALADAIGYARSLIDDDRRLWRTAYALRHRRFMASDASDLRQIATALAKIL